jgi:hypothetical protein
MALNAKIPAFGTKSMSATVEASAQQLSMQVMAGPHGTYDVSVLAASRHCNALTLTCTVIAPGPQPVETPSPATDGYVASPQVSDPIEIAGVLKLNTARFVLTNTSMSCAADGTLAGTSVAVSMTLKKGSSNGGTELSFDADTKEPLKLSSLFNRTWERQPESVSSFFTDFTIPAMAVSYSSAASTFTIKSTSSIEAFDKAMIFASPQITFTTKPRTTIRMETRLSIESMGINSAAATLGTEDDKLSLTVCNWLSLPNCF